MASRILHQVRPVVSRSLVHQQLEKGRVPYDTCAETRCDGSLARGGIGGVGPSRHTGRRRSAAERGQRTNRGPRARQLAISLPHPFDKDAVAAAGVVVAERRVFWPGSELEDGARLGPVELVLSPTRDGEQPRLELIGIGARLNAQGTRW